MNLSRFVSIKLTFFLVVGIVMGTYLDIPLPVALSCTLLSLAVLGFVFYNATPRQPKIFMVFVALTTLSIGALSYALWQPKNQKNHYSHYPTKAESVLTLKIREVLKSNSFHHRYIALVKERNSHRTSGKIVLNLPIDPNKKTLQVDDELITIGALKEIRAPLNPYQFNYRRYMERLGISHQLKVTHDSYLLSATPTPTIFGYAASLRNQLIIKLEEARFGREELSIVQALLLGQRHSISDETYDAYKDAGAVHILAVSGLHIGILLFLLQLLLSPLEKLPKGKTLKLIALIVLLWCFALLAGFSASVVRAVTMFSFVGYALYLNRPSNTFNILALSMFFILLLFNPMLLFQVGFQMSYTAVFAILWMYPILQRFWFPKNRIIRKIWQLLAVSIAAQIGVLPISLFYFHQFPGLFFVSNLVVVPFLGVLLGLGILVLVLAVSNALPDFLAEAYGHMIGMMNAVIAWVSAQEAFVFKNISFDAVQLVLVYLIIIALLLLLAKPIFPRVMTLLMTIVGFQFWLMYSTISSKQRQEVFLLHQNKNSVLLHQNGARLTVYSRRTHKTDDMTKEIVMGRRIEERKYEPLRNAYHVNDKRLLIIDSTGIARLNEKNEKVEYLVLTQSPKVNLERLIDTLKPQHIIADGSNYRTTVERWKNTCAKRKLPFHYTGEKGAFYFK